MKICELGDCYNRATHLATKIDSEVCSVVCANCVRLYFEETWNVVKLQDEN